MLAHSSIANLNQSYINQGRKINALISEVDYLKKQVKILNQRLAEQKNEVAEMREASPRSPMSAGN
jgi:hypothetical protein